MEHLHHRIQQLEEEVARLSITVKVLEDENGRLLEKLKNVQSDTETHVSPKLMTVKTLKQDSKFSKNKGKKDMAAYAKRYVALKIMYLGSRFHGFASQAGMQRTVESELFRALEKTKLLLGSHSEAAYSRCGRTDKGVSATGQVIALYLRSSQKLPLCLDGVDVKQNSEVADDAQVDRVATAKASRSDEKQFSLMEDGEEMDYVGVLNRALPDDMRVLGWCPAPPGFHARFSCLHREYKYFFLDRGLNIDAMKEAAKSFLGDHDFRNFCKMDAQNVHNYQRTIKVFDIFATRERWGEAQIWVMHVKGTAFLWHQVRCMAAILFMVGYGYESPKIVDDLLDINRTPRKPQYMMASEVALVLQNCEFEGLKFRCSPQNSEKIISQMDKQLSSFLLSATIISECISQLQIPGLSNQSVKSSHIPLSLRPTEPSYQERVQKCPKA